MFSRLLLGLSSFLAFYTFCQAELVPVECNFIIDWGRYTCELTSISIENDVTLSFAVGGEHAVNRTNEDVRGVLIQDAEVPFVFKELFETFPNIEQLSVFRGGLRTFQKNAFFKASKLERIEIRYNNITDIYPYAFIGATYVNALRLSENSIKTLHRHALVGLSNLYSLSINNNLIEEIPADFFRPAIRLRSLFAGDNNLNSLNGNTFLRKYQIDQVSFPRSNINKIERTFMENLNLISALNFLGNQCVNRLFVLSSTPVQAVVEALEPCFQNFAEEK